jgi:hypothetical protein
MKDYYAYLKAYFEGKPFLLDKLEKAKGRQVDVIKMYNQYRSQPGFPTSLPKDEDTQTLKESIISLLEKEQKEVKLDKGVAVEFEAGVVRLVNESTSILLTKALAKKLVKAINENLD